MCSLFPKANGFASIAEGKITCGLFMVNEKASTRWNCISSIEMMKYLM